MVDFVLSDDEALKLACCLIQAARQIRELMIAGVRQPAVKTGLHHVTVTYEPRKKK